MQGPTPWNRVLLGIGNPGPEYDGTRHNIGFDVVDLLAQRLGVTLARLERKGPDGKKRFNGKVKARVAEGCSVPGSDDTGFLLVQPLTYVNLSGQVAGPLLQHAQLPPESLFVVTDDLNLPLGRIRIRPSGSSGGHNGLKSIEAALTSKDYPRLRLGIGPVDGASPEAPRPSTDSTGAFSAGSHEEQVDFVLSRFLPDERGLLCSVLDRAADACLAWLRGTPIQTLMGEFNGDVTPLGETPKDTDPPGT